MMEAKIFIAIFLALIMFLGIRYVKYPKSSWKRSFQSTKEREPEEADLIMTRIWGVVLIISSLTGFVVFVVKMF